MDKIAAVVVTYNRFSLLKRTIESILGQTHKVDTVIVVNNGSTDGTREWLDTRNDLHVIHQSNVGGSGGFHRGIESAFRHGYDWIWCMDDDVYPEENCLETLLKYDGKEVGIICPRRIQNGKTFRSELVAINLTNPLRSLHRHIITEAHLKHDKVAILGMVFEGPLIKREVVERIGLPNKDYFLTYDDTDYSWRCSLAGFKIWYIPDAILFKEYFESNLLREEAIRAYRWKIEYHIRNTAYFCVTYGKNSCFRFFAPIRLLLYYELIIFKNLLFNNKYQISDIKRFFLSYKQGITGKLGKIQR